jgi:histidyl-tRNA synthetase
VDKVLLSGILNQKKLVPFISEKALRYDLTVPFARYVVQHRNELTFPFKRFQIQPVWRADRPQKGRYREFYQCDVDVIGSDSLLNEVELVQIIDSVFGKLNIPVTLKFNNRKLLAAIAQAVGAPDAFVDITVALDKLDKIGEEKVVEELKQRSISDTSIEKLLPLIRFQGDTQQKLAFLAIFLGENELGKKGIAEVQSVISTTSQPLISSNTIVELDLTLARGLNYYTGAIFEVKSNLPNTLTSTICGGGRYDDLTGIFGLPNVSGVGISFGADRIYDVLLEAGLFPDSAQEGTQVLFTNFGESESLYCLPMVKAIREAGISAELFPESGKMKKQLGYADNLGIPFVAMVGESEMIANVIALKNMKTGEQVSVTLAQLIAQLKGK